MAKSNKGGRPTRYRKEFAKQAEKLCQLGATDPELAQFFEVDRSTIWRWAQAHPEFCNALKVGKDAPDDRVERSLFERALGYSYIEQQAVKVQDIVYDKGKRVSVTERVEIVDVPRQLPPDTTAGIFWLKNRRKDLWRDKHEHALGGPDGGPIRVETMSDVEKAQRLMSTIRDAEKMDEGKNR